MLSLFSQFIFGSSSLFSGHHIGSNSSKLATLLWKDKGLCFDLRPSDLEIDHGEQLIGCFFPIEDIKGNQDELGVLKITNLRLIWICCNKKRVNLSIGWRSVSLAFEQNLKDSLGRSVTSLCIISKYESTKYEFVFNKMPAYTEIWNDHENWNTSMLLRKYINQGEDKASVISLLSPMYLDDPFEMVFKVWQTYKQTALFRHCRANLTHLLPKDSSIRLAVNSRVDEYSKLPGEETIDVYESVIQSESRSVKYSGTLISTNIRLVWIDSSLPLRNISIPYIRVDSLKLKQNRIIIKTLDYLATSNQLELCLQRAIETNKAKFIFEQLQNLYTLYKAKPKFGPECCEENLNFMSHLKPVEHYLGPSFDSSALRDIQNFGPEMNNGVYTDKTVHEVTNAQLGGSLRKAIKTDNSVDLSVDNAENELGKYSIKLNNYFNDQPIERDREIIYSLDLGLAVERPVKNMDLGRTWRMDLI